MSDQGFMIPDFDNNGNLPPGTHYSSIEEVIRRFGGSRSLKRSKLTGSLRDFYNFIKYYCIGVYIDGSYVTNRLSPNDVDLITIMKEEFRTNIAAQARLITIMSEYQTRKLHIFAFDEKFQVNDIKNYLATFTKDRDGNVKGIIYLESKK